MRERSVFLSLTLSVDLLPTSHSKKVAALQDFCERRSLRRRAHCDLLSPPKHNSLRERSVFACFRGRYSLRERSVFCLSSCITLSGFLPCLQGTLSERTVFPRALRIENAYVTYSLRCPSRATMLRGQYPHNHSILGNSLLEGGEKKFRQLGRDRSTIATWLDTRATGPSSHLPGQASILRPFLFLPLFTNVVERLSGKSYARANRLTMSRVIAA